MTNISKMTIKYQLILLVTSWLSNNNKYCRKQLFYKTRIEILVSNIFYFISINATNFMYLKFSHWY